MAVTTAAVVGAAAVGAVASSRAADKQADAAREAALIQSRSAEQASSEQLAAGQRAQGFFEPFAGVAERGVAESGFLADPQAQFQFLQDNPLFNLALQNANQQTQQVAASRGRLSAGDTLQQLSNNVLLSAQPLISQQRGDILNLLNLGQGVATSQANIETGQQARASDLSTSAAAAQAAGVVGAGSAEAAGTQAIGGAIQNALLGATLGAG